MSKHTSHSPSNCSIKNKSIHKCNICEKVFKCLSRLTDHSRVHTGEKPFQCSTCKKCFSEKGSLNKHKQIHESVRLRRHQCVFCSREYLGASALCYHLQQHIGEKPNSCSICSAEFRTTSHLAAHERSHHTSEKLFECSVCSRKFKNSSSLRVHVQSVHEKVTKVECPICQKQFSRLDSLKAHQRGHGHTGGRRVRCTICGKSLASTEILKRHLRAHTGENQFDCEICQKKFPFKSALESHIRTHTNEKPFKCSACQKNFKTKGELTKHVKVVHDKVKAVKKTIMKTHSEAAKRHECELCGMRFKDISKLGIHVRTHTGEKPFECGYTNCKKRFADNDKLARHASRVHLRKKAVQCVFCERGFFDRHSSYEHVLSHIREKPHFCKECGAEFGGQGNMMNHLKKCLNKTDG